MKGWTAVVISIISLIVSIIGVVFSILKDRRDNAKLSVTWDNKTVWLMDYLIEIKEKRS